MPDWKTRVETELRELRQKIEALDKFVQSDAFYNLNAGHRLLLVEQGKAMTEYARILKARLVAK